MKKFNGAIEATALIEGFNQAWTIAVAEYHQTTIVLAGRPVRLRVVGTLLNKKLLTVWQHLTLGADTNQTADLEILLWDHSLMSRTEDAHINLPDSLGASIEISINNRYVLSRQQGLTTLLDREKSRLIGYLCANKALSFRAQARPLEQLLRLWHRDLGINVIHAAMVAKNNQGVLLAGPSGAGKSTSALACLRAGFTYLGDDQVGLEAANSQTYLGHSLYNSILLNQDSLDKFPDLIDYAMIDRDQEESKNLIILSQIHQSLIVKFALIKVIILPRVSQESVTYLSPAKQSQALMQMLPNCLTLYPSWHREDFNTLATLIKDIPAYWLNLGGNPVDIAKCIHEAILKN
ncbi:serine kinase of the HPr protein, regulates carbohydrate metabolism [Synechococcus sp. PCC 6312]|uniref:serine kinase of the HPr protein, regulates carbohydrate metabolism n=1 Tax=Synechococcus sp. (strain ATCC 27167 / PCC 6312) TaxID=195253 RepID=UPI00029EC90E|nr:serine kinase of the HPr protein, regulates carbohydrate metabolism [Synechococcus sp. PCC 6312]AFY61437.1 serine kinase of the HPr protein, regulates carbohydrate metabolism [Synechococcus sp. PCC 6312]